MFDVLERDTDVLDNAMADGAAGTTLRTAEQVESGFPIDAVDRLTAMLSPDDPNFAYRLVPRATLTRRRATPGARLTTEESSKVLRVWAVWAMARKVWKDDAKARRWLFRPHMMLNDRPAIDVVLASEFGRPIVEGILGRAYYGIPS